MALLLLCFSDAVKVRHFIRYFALRRIRIEKKNASVIYKLANVFLVQIQNFSFYYSRTSLSDHRSKHLKRPYLSQNHDHFLDDDFANFHCF